MRNVGKQIFLWAESKPFNLNISSEFLMLIWLCYVVGFWSPFSCFSPTLIFTPLTLGPISFQQQWRLSRCQMRPSPKPWAAAGKRTSTCYALTQLWPWATITSRWTGSSPGMAMGVWVTVGNPLAFRGPPLPQAGRQECEQMALLSMMGAVWNCGLRSVVLEEGAW